MNGYKFFGYGDELAEIVGHKVDFNTSHRLPRRFIHQPLGAPLRKILRALSILR